MIKERNTTIGYHCPFCGMPILNNINIFSMTGNLIKIKCVCGNSELTVQILKDNKYRITVPCILCPNTHSFTLSSGVFFKKDLFSFSCKFTAIDICFIGKDNRVYEALKKNEEELMEAFAAYDEEYNKQSDGLAPQDDLFLDGGGYFEELEEFEEEDEYFDDTDDDDWYIHDDDDEEELDKYGGNYILKNEQNESGFILHKSNNNISPYTPENYEDYKNPKDSLETDSGGLENLKVRSYQIVAQILDGISKLYDEKKIECKCGNLDGKIVILGNSVHIECKNCGSYRNIKSSDASDAEYLDEIDTLYLDFND